MLKVTPLYCVMNENCCSVQRGRGICPHRRHLSASRVPAPGNLPSKTKLLMPGGEGHGRSWNWLVHSLRKLPTFCDAETSAEISYWWRVTSASDWLNQISYAARPIRSNTQIWLVTHRQCHEYGISALVPQTSFGGETSGSVAKCRVFSLVRYSASNPV